MARRSLADAADDAGGIPWGSGRASPRRGSRWRGGLVKRAGVCSVDGQLA